MATERDYQSLYDRIAALRDTVTSRLASDLISNPQLADAITKQIDDMLKGVVDADMSAPPPPDKGLAELAGIGPGAAKDFGQTRIPPGVVAYDETIPSERIIAVGDVYYLYQHEKIGVFRAVQKLQELFRAGTVRLSGGEGAFSLYQFDRREVLRYTRARPPLSLPPNFQLWRVLCAHRLAAQYRFSQAVRALCPSGHALLARQAHFRCRPRARLRPELRLHRDRAPRRP